MIQRQTKAMRVLNVNGTLRATEGSGAVDGNGQVTGRFAVDANSIDTKNKGAKPTFTARTSSRPRNTSPWSSTWPGPGWARKGRAR
jgi:hypothetical protein